jgi:hypothetical protein
MKQKSNIILFFILLSSSVIIYFVQNMIFDNPNQMLFILLGDLAFLPIEVALVTFVIERLLKSADQQKNAKKINVIISTYFTEAGSLIMKAMSEFNRNNTDIAQIIEENEIRKISPKQAQKMIASLKYDIYADPEKLGSLASVLADKKIFLINLLENNSLFEHDSFTDMLWAVFHVADELQSRGDLKTVPADVIDHLSNDLLRAYPAMVKEWIGYIFYLRQEYPFLYQAAKNKSDLSYGKSATI